MVIDLRNCVACGACSVVCSATNRIETNLWRRIVDCGLSEPPQRERLCVPMSCMHCSRPYCLEVCPTGATYSRSDGVVDVNSEKCIGCGFCILACPYRARVMVLHEEEDFDRCLEGGATSNAMSERVGVASKCNFCLPRIDDGLKKGLQPGIDQEATPMCVISCTAKALHFGDLDDPQSNVSRLIKENRSVRFREDLGAEPSMYYLV
jgi:phenylacetyl-CoA:acceptor oxidoreductase 27-kDa subunit